MSLPFRVAAMWCHLPSLYVDESIILSVHPVPLVTYIDGAPFVKYKIHAEFEAAPPLDLFIRP